jgi:hypothetical protein
MDLLQEKIDIYERFIQDLEYQIKFKYPSLTEQALLVMINELREKIRHLM